MPRIVITFLLVAHGLVHLIGVAGSWGLARPGRLRAAMGAFAGRIEPGSVGARMVGLAWLSAALAFFVLAAGVWRHAAWAIPVAFGASALSLPLCVAGSPRTTSGVAVDVVILLAALYLHVNGSGAGGVP